MVSITVISIRRSTIWADAAPACEAALQYSKDPQLYQAAGQSYEAIGDTSYRATIDDFDVLANKTTRQVKIDIVSPDRQGARDGRKRQNRRYIEDRPISEKST